MFQNIQNEIDFWLRRRLKWSVKPVNHSPKIIDNSIVVSSKARQLINKYPCMENYLGYLSEEQWLENLNALELLNSLTGAGSARESCKPGNNQHIINVLEVGMKNWSTLPALTTFLKTSFPNATIDITGIELDLWRLYANGKSRFTVLNENVTLVQQLTMANMLKLQYLEGDVCQFTTAQSYQSIFCFLPFVFQAPHLKWGLPKRYFKPGAFFKKLYELLTEDGILILTNQGDLEFEKQRQLLEPYAFDILFSGPVQQDFLPLKYTRYAWVLQKKATL